jgi:CspA family cold shock protein
MPALSTPVVIRKNGVVRSFDGSKGYGYIDAENGLEVFVDYIALPAHGPALLSAGEHVSFSLVQTVRGPRALDVVRSN